MLATLVRSSGGCDGCLDTSFSGGAMVAFGRYEFQDAMVAALPLAAMMA